MNYEKFVTTLLPFPRGEDSTVIEKSRHERVKEAYDWWVLLELQGYRDEGTIEVIDRHFRLIDVSCGKYLDLSEGN
jgi:hypothetical protein